MRNILAALLLPLIASPSFAQDVASYVPKANQMFVEAFDKGDASALAQMYTDHATVLPPGAAMTTGRAAIENFWHAAMQRGLKHLSLETVNVEDYGEAAREIGRFTVEAPDQQGQAAKVEGKYVVIWKKAGGGWKLDTEIWNTDQ